MRTKHVVVEEYNPMWKDAFVSIQDYLYQVVPRRFEIEHVGSTSVEGLCAKPIIDVDIVYFDEQDRLLLIDILVDFGYIHEGDLGIANRDAFKYEYSPWMKHHLYVIKGDSVAYLDHVYLRDFLTIHEEEKKQYGDLKTTLAKQYAFDIDAYYLGKSMFIQKLLKKASIWMMENK